MDKKTLLWGKSTVSTGKTIQSEEMTQLFDFDQIISCNKEKSVINVKVIEQLKARDFFKGLWKESPKYICWDNKQVFMSDGWWLHGDLCFFWRNLYLCPCKKCKNCMWVFDTKHMFFSLFLQIPQSSDHQSLLNAAYHLDEVYFS